MLFAEFSDSDLFSQTGRPLFSRLVLSAYSRTHSSFRTPYVRFSRMRSRWRKAHRRVPRRFGIDWPRQRTPNLKIAMSSEARMDRNRGRLFYECVAVRAHSKLH